MEYACETDSIAALGKLMTTTVREGLRVAFEMWTVKYHYTATCSAYRESPSAYHESRRSSPGRRRCQSANQERSQVSQLLPDSMRATRYWEPHSCDRRTVPGPLWEGACDAREAQGLPLGTRCAGRAGSAPTVGSSARPWGRRAHATSFAPLRHAERVRRKWRNRARMTHHYCEPSRVWTMHHRDRVDRTDARSSSDIRCRASSPPPSPRPLPSCCGKGIKDGACETNDGGRSE